MCFNSLLPCELLDKVGYSAHCVTICWRACLLLKAITQHWCFIIKTTVKRGGPYGLLRNPKPSCRESLESGCVPSVI